MTRLENLSLILRKALASLADLVGRRDEAPGELNETVILLHGMGRTRGSMAILACATATSRPLLPNGVKWHHVTFRAWARNSCAYAQGSHQITSSVLLPAR